ncbi:MAG: hypothetical protein ACJ76D_00815, partial [Solirubrobacterales bacterium]
MGPLIPLALGGVFGLLVARWWALGVAPLPGLLIAASTDVDEVPPSFLGTVYALATALAIALG